MKHHELKPILPIVIGMSALYLLMGLGGFWTTEPLGSIQHQQEAGYWILSFAVLSNWFHRYGPFLVNFLAILLVLSLNASPGQLQFHLTQPISRGEFLFRQLRNIGMVVGVFVLVGTCWTVFGQGVFLKWGLIAFKSMLLMWLEAMAWAGLTAGVLLSVRLPALLLVPGVMVVMFLGHLLLLELQNMALSPIYLMQLRVPAEVYQEGLSHTRGLEVLASDAYKRTYAGDVKFLWAILTVGLFSLLAHLGFQRRRLI